jgi:hypothetical protein
VGAVSGAHVVICRLPRQLSCSSALSKQLTFYYTNSLDRRTLVPLLLGVLGLVGFVVSSVYLSPEPLIRRSLFNSSTAIVAYFGTLIHGIIVWSLLYYMPLYFEVAKNYSPVTSGVALFPFTFTVAPAAVMVGIVITKTGRYRPSIVSAFLDF